MLVKLQAWAEKNVKVQRTFSQKTEQQSEDSQKAEEDTEITSDDEESDSNMDEEWKVSEGARVRSEKWAKLLRISLMKPLQGDEHRLRKDQVNQFQDKCRVRRDQLMLARSAHQKEIVRGKIRLADLHRELHACITQARKSRVKEQDSQQGEEAKLEESCLLSLKLYENFT